MENTDPGRILRSADIDLQAVTDDELKAINKHTLRPLKADDVFTFSAVLCDNAVDRTYEYFTDKALQDLRALFVGRPLIKDHVRRTDNMVGRIYAAEVVDTGKKLPDGAAYKQLRARVYMLRTDANADLIRDIEGGIKKEGSVGCAIKSAFCSICGVDNTKSYCRHWPGEEYDTEGGKKLCLFKLDGGADAYEFSLCAVPAQPAAGAVKTYTGTEIRRSDEEPEPETETQSPAADDRERVLTLRARLADK